MLLDFQARSRERTTHMYRQATAHATGSEQRELDALLGLVQAGEVSDANAQERLRALITSQQRRAA